MPPLGRMIIMIVTKIIIITETHKVAKISTNILYFRKLLLEIHTINIIQHQYQHNYLTLEGGGGVGGWGVNILTCFSEKYFVPNRQGLV